MRCQICFLPFNGSARCPKTLQCGHSYCQQCLQKIIDCRTSAITCPKDRRVWPVPNGDVNQLATNFMLLEILEQNCEECDSQPKKESCIAAHCAQMLCKECKEIHTKNLHDSLITKLNHLKDKTDQLQTLSDDTSHLAMIKKQSEATTAEVTNLLDALRDKLLKTVRERLEQDLEAFFQRKTKVSIKCAESRFIIKQLSLNIEDKDTDTIKDGDFDEVSGHLSQAMSDIEEAEKVFEAPTEFSLQDIPEIDQLMNELHKIIDQKAFLLYASSDILFDIKALSGAASNQAVEKTPDYKSAVFASEYPNRDNTSVSFNYPFAACTSPISGDIALTDVEKSRVHILTPDLQPVMVINCGESSDELFVKPVGVAFNETGHMFITEWNNSVIQVRDGNGVLLRKFGSLGSGPMQCNSPKGIAYDHGCLYICDSENKRVLIITEDGTHVKTIGDSGDGFNFIDEPLNLAVSTLHNKLFVTDYPGNLYLFSSEGVHKQTIKKDKPPYKFQAGGVAIDKYGNSIISDRQNGSLIVMGLNDEIITQIFLPGSQKMVCPLGITLTLEGDIIVCDRQYKIIKFTVPQVLASSND